MEKNDIQNEVENILRLIKACSDKNYLIDICKDRGILKTSAKSGKLPSNEVLEEVVNRELAKSKKDVSMWVAKKQIESEEEKLSELKEKLKEKENKFKEDIDKLKGKINENIPDKKLKEIQEKIKREQSKLDNSKKKYEEGIKELETSIKNRKEIIYLSKIIEEADDLDDPEVEEARNRIKEIEKYSPVEKAKNNDELDDELDDEYSSRGRYSPSKKVIESIVNEDKYTRNFNHNLTDKVLISYLTNPPSKDGLGLTYDSKTKLFKDKDGVPVFTLEDSPKSWESVIRKKSEKISHYGRFDPDNLASDIRVKLLYGYKDFSDDIDDPNYRTNIDAEDRKTLSFYLKKYYNNHLLKTKDLDNLEKEMDELKEELEKEDLSIDSIADKIKKTKDKEEKKLLEEDKKRHESRINKYTAKLYNKKRNYLRLLKDSSEKKGEPMKLAPILNTRINSIVSNMNRSLSKVRDINEQIEGLEHEISDMKSKKDYSVAELNKKETKLERLKSHINTMSSSFGSYVAKDGVKVHEFVAEETSLSGDTYEYGLDQVDKIIDGRDFLVELVEKNYIEEFLKFLEKKSGDYIVKKIVEVMVNYDLTLLDDEDEIRRIFGIHKDDAESINYKNFTDSEAYAIKHFKSVDDFKKTIVVRFIEFAIDRWSKGDKHLLDLLISKRKRSGLVKEINDAIDSNPSFGYFFNYPKIFTIPYILDKHNKLDKFKKFIEDSEESESFKKFFNNLSSNKFQDISTRDMELNSHNLLSLVTQFSHQDKNLKNDIDINEKHISDFKNIEESANLKKLENEYKKYEESSNKIDEKELNRIKKNLEHFEKIEIEKFTKQKNNSKDLKEKELIDYKIELINLKKEERDSSGESKEIIQDKIESLENKINKFKKSAMIKDFREFIIKESSDNSFINTYDLITSEKYYNYEFDKLGNKFLEDLSGIKSLLIKFSTEGKDNNSVTNISKYISTLASRL